MFEEINAHRQNVANNIIKAFDEDIEKAHQDGDIHPKHPDWVWVSSAAGGKGDWRKLGGRTHQNHASQVSQGGSGSSDSQVPSGGSNSTPKAEKLGQQASNVKVDTTTIDDAEYKRIYAQAKSVDNKSLSMGLDVINSNISKYKKDLEDTITKRPGAKATIKQLQDKLTKFVSQKKAVEDVIAELEKKGSSGQANHTASENAMPHISLTQSDFKKTYLTDEDFKNAPLKLHEYTAESVEYYDNDGNKKKATPFITEYYASSKQNKVGGYEAYFDRSDSIGTFKTLSDAISALDSWVNKMRVKGHSKPKWIYNANKGNHQMNYSLNVPASTAATTTTKKPAKAEFSSDNKDDIMKEINASKEAIKKYLGYSDAEITGIQSRGIISGKDKDGKNFKGIMVTVSYNATDMYGRKGRKQPIDIVIDSNGYMRNHSSYAPSPRAAVQFEYGAPGRHLVPSLKDKFEVK